LKQQQRSTVEVITTNVPRIMPRATSAAKRLTLGTTVDGGEEVIYGVVRPADELVEFVVCFGVEINDRA